MTTFKLPPGTLPDNNNDGHIDLSGNNRLRYGSSTLWVMGERDGLVWYSTEKGAQMPPVQRGVLLPNVAPPVHVKPTTMTATKEFKTSVAQVYGDIIANGRSVAFKQKTVDLTKLVMTDVSLKGSSGLFRNYGGNLSNVLFDRISMVDAQYAPGVAAGIFYHTNGTLTDATFRNLLYRGVEPITSAGDIYAVITLAGKGAEDKGSGFVIEDFDFEGMLTDYTGSSEGKYANRDGLAIEGGYVDGRITRGRIAHVADACIDLKGTGWVIDDVTLEDARENIKLWADTKIGALKSVSPRFAHILSTKKGLHHTVDYMEPLGDKQLVRFEGGINQVVEIKEFGLLSPTQVIATRDAASKGSKVVMPDGKVFTP